jgi:large subunit ribosomal protein L3
MRMPGHMGDDRVTVKNLEIMEVDEKNNIILIKGAVPGARNGLILIQGNGELKIKIENKKEDIKTEEEKVEEKPEEKMEEKEEETKPEIKEPETVEEKKN